MKKITLSIALATLMLAGCNDNAQDKPTKATALTITEQSTEVQKVGYAVGSDYRRRPSSLLQW